MAQDGTKVDESTGSKCVSIDPALEAMIESLKPLDELIAKGPKAAEDIRLIQNYVAPISGFFSKLAVCDVRTGLAAERLNTVAFIGQRKRPNSEAGTDAEETAKVTGPLWLSYSPLELHMLDSSEASKLVVPSQIQGQTIRPLGVRANYLSRSKIPLPKELVTEDGTKREVKKVLLCDTLDSQNRLTFSRAFSFTDDFREGYLLVPLKVRRQKKVDNTTPLEGETALDDILAAVEGRKPTKERSLTLKDNGTWANLYHYTDFGRERRILDYKKYRDVLEPFSTFSATYLKPKKVSIVMYRNGSKADLNDVLLDLRTYALISPQTHIASIIYNYEVKDGKLSYSLVGPDNKMLAVCVGVDDFVARVSKFFDGGEAEVREMIEDARKQHADAKQHSETDSGGSPMFG